MPAKRKRPGERARDERRNGGPRYGGGRWELADERDDHRFGVARNDDADPSELAPGEAEDVDDERPVIPPEEPRPTQTSGQRTGMRRPEKPRRLKARAKRR